MPGGTKKYGLPYLLPTEGLYTIANVTRLLAERLEALLADGTIGSGGGETPTGDGVNMPAGAAVMAAASIDLPGWTAHNVSWLQEWTAYGVTVDASGLTVPRKGIYLVTCQSPWENVANDAQAQLKLYSAGVQVGAAASAGGAQGWETVACISTMVVMNAGDKLTASAIHGGSTNAKFGGTIQGGVRTRLSAQCMYYLA